MSEARAHEERVEKLAAHAHKQWSGWMKYMLGKCEQGYDSDNFDALVIPNWAVERWAWQAHTPYADLPEEMKQSDRDEAMGILEVLGVTERAEL